jgi:DNA uptake protein ComE-like DNA-binding protein
MQFKEFLYFQKNDRRAIVFLLLLVVIAVALFFGIGGHHSKTEMTASDSIEMKKSPLSARGYGYNHGYYEVNGRRAELFPFDPNTADSTQLLRLGLSPWQVRNIYKYRAKGGVYRQPSDFARIYGLTVKQYRQLEPYIHISDDYSPASRLAGGSVAYDPLDRDTAKYPVKIRPTEKVYVNSADTQMLKRVPGIGSYFARQIVNYREF